jgi:alcohol dehydrogenase (cytochrome c)
VGNPENNRNAPGDNLYGDSIVALDSNSGRLKWHYQFTPHDQMDWDAAQVPVLADFQWNGRIWKLVMIANKNGLFYVFDRWTGQLLTARPFVEVNWMMGFDQRGRPNRVPGYEVRGANAIFPGSGGTSWFPPSFSPETGLFYVSAKESGARDIRFDGDNYGALRALDPHSGEQKWEFKRADAIFGGVLTTASNLVFVGIDAGCRSRTNPEHPRRCQSGRGVQTPPDGSLLPEGRIFALDAISGDVLWQTSLPGTVQAAPMSYSVGGKQFVAVAAGNTLFAFSLSQ